MSNLPRLPLAALHQKSGARMLDLDGFEVVAAYDGATAEIVALSEACGLVDRSWVGRLELRGEDRQRFLNGLVTNDVAVLEAGCCDYGFFTNIQGRVLSDVHMLALEDRLWLEVAPGRAKVLQQHLKTYRVADRVEILPLEDVLVLTVMGPQATSDLASLGVETCDVGRNARSMLLGTEVQVARRSLFGLDAFDLWVSSSIASDLWQGLTGGDVAFTAVGFEALEQQRIRSATPRFGRDFDDDSLPQETGLLQNAVSFDKGCYLGQEIVARLHYKGTPKRELRCLDIQSPVRPAEGTRLLLDDEPVGALSSVAYWPENGRWSALSVIDRRALDAPALSLEGGGEATVLGQSPSAAGSGPGPLG